MAYTKEAKRKKKLGIIESMRESGSPSITPFPGKDESDAEEDGMEEELPATHRGKKSRLSRPVR